MYLVIAEKPSVAMSIAKVLGATTRQDGYYEGSGYFVSWCVGHLVELATAEQYNESYGKWDYKDLPILPVDWQYNIAKGKEKQIQIIQALMNHKEVDAIVCATDAGREGELIFRLVYEKVGCIKPVKRLWISSMEDESISRGFANLHDGEDFDNLYQAALCRAKADWIVGINATRLFSVLYGQTLHIGRVMSPTLAMICKRTTDIATFQSEAFYTPHLDCGDFSVTGEKLKDRAVAMALQKACNGRSVVIEGVEQKDKVEKPPRLYDLTTLQREANKHFGFTAQQTLEYTQSLYEKKLVTYPRTDSRYLTEDMQNTIPAVVNAIAGFFMLESNSLPVNVSQVTDNSKVSDHHAITPTVKVKGLDLQSLPFGERETLRLIAMRLLTATNEDHIFAETIITAKCADTIFSTKGKTVLEEGFKAIQKRYEEVEEKAEKPLPILNIGDTFTAHFSIKEGKTTSPKEYTDDTLLSAMQNSNNAVEDTERRGIGTPATRAGIMEKLIKTGLVERKGDKKTKYFVPTNKGIALVTVLPEAIRSPLLTAEWEEKLKLIEQGKLSAHAFLEEITEMTSSLVQNYQSIKGADTLFPSERESVGNCPRCGADITENKKGFCCSNKACSFAIWKANKFFTAKKKTVTKAMVAELLKNGKVALKGCYSEKTGRNYDCTALLADSGGQFVGFKMVFGKK